jgi:hypothetical protein
MSTTEARGGSHLLVRIAHAAISWVDAGQGSPDSMYLVTIACICSAHVFIFVTSNYP